MWMGRAMAGIPPQPTAHQSTAQHTDQTWMAAARIAHRSDVDVSFSHGTAQRTTAHTLMSDKILSKHVVWCVECTVSIGCHWFVLGVKYQSTRCIQWSDLKCPAQRTVSNSCAADGGIQYHYVNHVRSAAVVCTDRPSIRAQAEVYDIPAVRRRLEPFCAYRVPRPMTAVCTSSRPNPDRAISWGTECY